MVKASHGSGRGAVAAIPLCLCVVVVLGCGPTRVKINKETDAVGLPKPAMVYVYDFAVHPSEVKLDQGGPLARIRARLSGGGDVADEDQQAVDLGHQVADILASELVEKITAMGLPAQRISRDQIPPVGAVAVGGQFVDVDQGNKVKRMAIGFHQGQSSVAAQVQLYSVTGERSADQLLDFTAVSQSPPTPGAAVTMGAGAAVQVAGAAAGAKALGDSVQQDTNRLASRVATNLQTFFAKQGWTAPPSTIDTLQMPQLP